jgi:hypothetical protein
MIDESSDYLHIIITSANDECSEATLNDIIKLNFILKKKVKNYKCACISYNSKGNDKLRQDLTSISLSVVKPEQEELGR